MKQYVLVYKFFNATAFAGKCIDDNKFEIKIQYYDRSERELFLEKWESFTGILNMDRFELIKAMYIDLDTETITNITDRFDELKNAI